MCTIFPPTLQLVAYLITAKLLPHVRLYSSQWRHDCDVETTVLYCMWCLTYGTSIVRTTIKLSAAVTCRFPAGTHRQALKDFPDTSQVWLHKNNKINLPML
jgi:hypothetical protein